MVKTVHSMEYTRGDTMLPASPQDPSRPLVVIDAGHGGHDPGASGASALGGLKEKTLTLHPGRYVAVGTRKGYRDARVTFDVAAGRAPAPVHVRCAEAL